MNSVESRNYKVAELIGEGVRIEAPKGVRCGEGVSPSPRGRDLGKGVVPPPQKNFANIACKMMHIHRFFLQAVLYHC